MESDPIQIAWYVEGNRFACLFFNVMTRIGPYTLLRHSYARRVNGEDVAVTDELCIQHESGEAMGCGAETEAKLIAMLSEFWQAEF